MLNNPEFTLSPYLRKKWFGMQKELKKSRKVPQNSRQSVEELPVPLVPPEPQSLSFMQRALRAIADTSYSWINDTTISHSKQKKSIKKLQF